MKITVYLEFAVAVAFGLVAIGALGYWMIQRHRGDGCNQAPLCQNVQIVFLFANSKCKRYFHNRLRPAKLTWTAVYRKQHKKDIAAETVKKRRRTTKKPYSRSIVGATLEVIQKKRAEKPEVRDAAREAALREIKERNKKSNDEKKAKKAELISKTKTSKGNVPKGAIPKGPKLGGGGGKR
ncbi:60S ribosomal L24-like [Olea europaea subsp. europaea]|uniref:60S ribosomal L24-like n=1 Tax=Olea europaea subsp. europaea TaxID=158383 RepID=A0A8S0T9T3_OLEEU|nr:60S ribosomal L24-like [Olea europaea subsp. europaea]